MKKFILFYIFGFSTVLFCSWTQRQCLCVDFHQSMSADFANHDEQFCRTDPKWILAENLYKNHFQYGVEFTNEPRIPYIIHHIWLGSNFPDYAKNFRQTWIAQHKDWTFILWTDYPEKAYGNIVLHSFNELDAYLKMSNREQYIIMDMNSVRLQNWVAYETRARNYGEKSDLIRYEALHIFGGLYVDTDFECLRSFKDFNHCLDFYTGIAHSKEFSLYNGLIGAAPGMSILAEVNELLKSRIRTNESSVDANNSLKYCGPHFLTQCFVRRAAGFEGKAVAFPVTYFYAWPAYQRFENAAKAKKYLVPESCALHYWKVSWNQNKSVPMRGFDGVLDYYERV